jgi:hypothetical protein
MARCWAGCWRRKGPDLPSLLVMARTVSRTKEANPYESAAITEVRVEGCGAELARACFPDQSLSRVQRTGPAEHTAGRWLAGRRRAFG